jgi:hypothetical protein
VSATVLDLNLAGAGARELGMENDMTKFTKKSRSKGAAAFIHST